jgi:hypothetical protein
VSEVDRKAFACPRVVGETDGIDLRLLDPADEHDRRMLIEAEHPDLKQALDDDVRDIRRGADVMNPRLHITMHEIVANQLWADEPPEVWQTAKRLVGAGYERHEVLHMLGSVVSGQVWASLRKDAPDDLERVRLKLAALPEGWESMRETWPIERSRNRAERRAEERRRRADALEGSGVRVLPGADSIPVGLQLAQLRPLDRPRAPPSAQDHLLPDGR